MINCRQTDYGQFEKYEAQREKLRAITNSEMHIPPKTFPANKENRAMINAVKSAHKQALLKAGLNPRKVMNLPNVILHK